MGVTISAMHPRRSLKRTMMKALGGIVLVLQFRVPVSLPPLLSISESRGFVFATGTWTIEGDRPAFPLQTSRIECYQPEKKCRMATAEIGIGEMLHVETYEYPVVEWNATSVVFVEDAPICVRYEYTINWATQTASGIRTSKNISAPACDVFRAELRLSLKNGFDVWHGLTYDALPWYGRLARLPFTIFSGR